MSEERRDQVLDHSYDGIQEYDNRLPNWWLYTLYGAIVFGVFYWLYFQTTGAGALPTEHYEQEMVDAAEAQLARMEGQELTDESLLLVASIPDRVTAGRALFEQFCLVCHGQQGEGSVGPNLTDEFWINGGDPMSLHRTITNGVTEKGMAAWGNQLGPRRVQDAVAYVLSIKNTNIAGKEPQGEPEGSKTSAPATETPADTTPADATPADPVPAEPTPGDGE